MGTLREKFAFLKKLNIINAGKAKKTGAPFIPVTHTSTRKAPIKPGDVFGHLTAIEPRPSVHGYAMWLFECRCRSATNDARFVARVATVRHNLRKIGWASCATCYRAAGGWEAIKALSIAIPSDVLERLGAVKTRLSEKPPLDVDPTTVERIVSYVNERPSFVKITTAKEIQKELKLARNVVFLALHRAVRRGLLTKKHMKHANGYVAVQKRKTLTIDKEVPAEPAYGIAAPTPKEGGDQKHLLHP
jgi:hypothetical protein